jgi:site-specific DNA-methyltransferase (cytosine-N4-specific)
MAMIMKKTWEILVMSNAAAATATTSLPINQVIQGDCYKVLQSFPANSIDVCLTSPPYWMMRVYAGLGPRQLGLEPDFRQYIDNLVIIFGQVKRVLKPTGSCFVVIGDSYNTSKVGNTNGIVEQGGTVKQKAGLNEAQTQLVKPLQAGVPEKSLLHIPQRFAIAMTDKGGWCCRNDIIWNPASAMPDTQPDRFGFDYELVLFYTKTSHGYYHEQQREPTIDGKKTRAMRSVWRINTKGSDEDKHYAGYPVALCEPIIKSACPPDGIILDPFMGSGTTAIAALNLARKFVGIEMSAEYVAIARDRIRPYLQQTRLF